MKTTFVVSSALVLPRFVNLLIGIPMFAMFSYFVFTTVGSPFQPSFYNVWNNILSDYTSNIEWIRLNDVNDWNDFMLNYTDRATATLGIMALISTMGSGIEISFVLEFALHVANNIAHWQSDLPIENQEAVVHIFQDIHISALELITVCNNVLTSNTYIPREDTIRNIYPLLKTIFRGYCSIYSSLGGNWETLIHQFQADMLRQMSFSDAISYMSAFVNSHIN